jgi:phage portal protein BeeE
MGPFARLSGRKGFTVPPFWSSDSILNSAVSPGWSDRETIENDMEAYVRDAYKASGVVFSTAVSRMFLFAQARIQFQQFIDGRPKPLWGTKALSLLERPWPNGSTLDLLARMDQDTSNAGNSYWTTVDSKGRFGQNADVNDPDLRVARMRPDWVTIVKGSQSGDLRALDTHVIGYIYRHPGATEDDEVLLLPSEVTHYAPLPDPDSGFRGMSWMTPILREIQADKAATKHKDLFFKNGAQIQHVAKLDKSINPEQFAKFVRMFQEKHQGVDNAYKTLFLGGGADLTPVMSNMKEMDFKNLQGGGETRIASAAGMHPVVVGLSEGLEGSSLNAGNFKAAIRLTADKTLRYLWSNAAASLESLVTLPADGVRLTYDDRDISFLREDSTDVAAIQQKQAETANRLTEAGFLPESVIEFLETGDLKKLKHSGLFSVQLQAPGKITPPTEPVAAIEPPVPPVVVPQGE